MATYYSEAGHITGISYEDEINHYLHPNGSGFDYTDGPVIDGPVLTIAAAGANQAGGTAVSLNCFATLVTGASGTNGVTINAPTQVGTQITIINTNGSNALLVYPDSGGTGGKIGNGAANASFSLAAGKSVTLICSALSPTQWWSTTN